MKKYPTVRLRAVEPEDLDLLYLIENDAKLWNVGATNVPYSRYVLHDYIANSASDIYADKQLRLIIEREDGVVVGIADLVSFNPRNLRAEIGLVIIDEYRSRGYGFSALSQLLEYASRTLNLHQLYCITGHDNLACLALFAKMGFHKSAVLKDWLARCHGFEDAYLLTKIL